MTAGAAGQDGRGGGDPAAAEPLVPAPRAGASVVYLKNQWFVAARSRELGRRPLATSLFGTPIVLFRDAAGRAGALVDRCPHRNVPLSLGRVAGDGTLECAYHGWRFDARGGCRFVPSLTSASEAKARRAHAFPTVEQQGFVWVYSSASPGLDAVEAPRTSPHRFELLDAEGYDTVVQVVEARGTLYSTIENALDVPHTAFLHRGLFRSASRGVTVTARVRRERDRVVAEYVGEPRPTGMVARVLSPSGGIVTHFDRFILPSIAQVEYRIGTENHLVVDSAMTPLGDFSTRIYAVVSYRTRLPRALVRPLVRPLALRIFGQDAFILSKQTETIRAFGGEQFASTEVDVLGRHVWRLLRAAERGDTQPGEEQVEVRLVV
ncbi:MAG TPA: aromatic ring-hydroxylating dioxygenase subunit alpha [Polyangiaceae bacterium]|nr:aromatic ring-hydroxylating dioxygenase subunit alpha [Polyangiaceae bacterium]